MNKEVLVCTNNEGKINDYKKLFGDDWKVYSLSDFNIVSDPEETGKNYNTNALIKLNEIGYISGYDGIIISDDSGVEIDALPGELGVYTSRYLQGSTYNEKCINIINRLQGVKNRKASYHTVLLMKYNYSQVICTFHGYTEGTIAESYKEGGFGLDPIFLYEGKYFADLPTDVERKVGARGQCVEALKRFLGNS